MTAAAKTASRVSTVKTPGEPSGDTPMTATGETDADALMAGAADMDDDGGTDKRPEPVITMTPAQLDAAIARGIAQHQASMRASAGHAVKDAELPDQSTIDIDKIDRPVLSAQGYVVPRDYGKPKAQINPL